VVWTYPPSEATRVPIRTSIRVQFDRFLAPDSPIRQAICVQAESPPQGTDQCIGGLAPEYDPVDRVAVWKGAALLASQRYNVRLFVPQNADDPTGVRAIDGVALTEEYRFAFTTAASAADIDPVFVEPNRAITFCSTSAYCPLPSSACTAPTPDPFLLQSPNALLKGCSRLSYCHGQPTPALTGVVAGSALTLTDPNDSVPAAVQRLVDNSVVATETAVEPDPAAARRSSKDVFGVNMPYIDAKNPGNSYLLYKLILALPPRCSHLNEESANPAAAFSVCTGGGKYASPEGFIRDEYLCTDIKPTNTNCDAGAMPPNVDGGAPVKVGERIPPIVPSWVPDDQWQPPVSGEYDRLRLHVRGDGMGPGGPNNPSGRQNTLAVSAWIAAGAPTMSCP